MEPAALSPTRWSRGEQILGVLIAGVGVTLVVAGELPGAVLAALFVAVWLLAGTPSAFVVGQVGLVVGLDGGLTTPLPQAALLVVLLVDAAIGRDPATAAGSLAVSAAATAGLLTLQTAIVAPLLAGGAIIGSSGLVVYVIHRYEQLALGLVGEPE
jgi:hypothetical protein